MLSQARNFIRFLRGEYHAATTPEDALKDVNLTTEFLALTGVE